MSLSAFVIGHPVAHSRSPLIHGYWFKKYGVRGDYLRIDVSPEALPAFVASLRDGAYVGGNVTVPLKQDVLALCDRTDDKAQTIGAVNTLIVNDNHLFGMNSDWYGFLANLDETAKGWDREPGAALVLGAGGAARAIVVALIARGFSPIRILNRTAGRAESLALELGAVAGAGGAKVSGHALSQFADWSEQARLVVNTSSVGMHGTCFENLPLAGLPKDALVSDIVYTPLVTPLLADAAALGLRTIDGLGMLLHQAVPAFEAWYGVRPEVTPELRALIERDMGLK
jgi:shikimate dehydrogenase